MSSVHLSKRGSAPSIAQQLSDIARQTAASGQQIHYLNVGQPSSGAPKGAMAKLSEAAKTSNLGYTHSVGIPQLRERIAQHYEEVYGAIIHPNRVIVTIGASGAFILGLVGMFDAGKRIGLPVPCYYSYIHLVETLGLKPVLIPTRMENNFQPTIDELEAVADQIDGLIMTSPSNPTGSIILPDALKRYSAFCHHHDITFFCDEIYHGIVYTDTKIATALNHSDDLIVTNSYSKYYSMAGWRLGWMVVPEAVVTTLSNLARNLYLAPPTPSQWAALGSMDSQHELETHVAKYRKNRNIMLEALPKAGFDRICPPDGAFYVYAHTQHLHEDSIEFCKQMIREAGICAAPGSEFDPIHGHHHVRFSYAGATADIEAAMEALIAWRNA